MAKRKIRAKNAYTALTREEALARDTLGQSIDIESELVLDNPEMFLNEGGHRSIADTSIQELDRRHRESGAEFPMSGDDIGKMEGLETKFPYGKYESPYLYGSDHYGTVFRDFDENKNRVGLSVMPKRGYSRVDAPPDRGSDPARRPGV
jgi:hypothetical protein